MRLSRREPHPIRNARALEWKLRILAGYQMYHLWGRRLEYTPFLLRSTRRLKSWPGVSLFRQGERVQTKGCWHAPRIEAPAKGILVFSAWSNRPGKGKEHILTEGERGGDTYFVGLVEGSNFTVFFYNVLCLTYRPNCIPTQQQYATAAKPQHGVHTRSCGPHTGLAPSCSAQFSVNTTQAETCPGR